VSKGQIVLPAELRRQDRIGVGQEFEIESSAFLLPCEAICLTSGNR